jgi:solute carrier family 25 aspartate/glutamate transporter 12/13
MRERRGMYSTIFWVFLIFLEISASAASSASFAPHGFGLRFPASLEDARKDLTTSFKAATSASKDFFVGATAGGIASFTVFPIDLAKTRMQDQIVITGKSPKYTNTFQTLAKVAQTEGFRGLYSGVFPVVIGTAPSAALQLGGNNQAKTWFAKHLNVDVANLPLQFEVLAGAFAGMCQVAAANPMESVKVVKQVQGRRAGSTWTIARRMGIGGLYQVKNLV